MGSKTKVNFRRMLAPGTEQFTSADPRKSIDQTLKSLKSSVALDGPLRFSSGKSQKARQASQKQDEQIRVQRQKEQVKLADAEDEIGKRKAVAKSKTVGRSLLTATSPTSAPNLGG